MVLPLLLLLSESTSYHHALSHLEWQLVMAEEIGALERTSRDLVFLQPLFFEQERLWGRSPQFQALNKF